MGGEGDEGDEGERVVFGRVKGEVVEGEGGGEGVLGGRIMRGGEIGWWKGEVYPRSLWLIVVVLFC